MEDILGIAVIGGAIWTFMYVMGRVLFKISGRSSESEVDKFRSRFYTEQMNRNAVLLDLGWKLKADPRNETLLSMYAEEKAAYVSWSNQQEQTLLKMEGYVIDEQTQYELDNGINPYSWSEKKPKQSKRERLGWQEE